MQRPNIREQGANFGFQKRVLSKWRFFLGPLRNESIFGRLMFRQLTPGGLDSAVHGEEAPRGGWERLMLWTWEGDLCNARKHAPAEPNPVLTPQSI